MKAPTLTFVMGTLLACLGAFMGAVESKTVLAYVKQDRVIAGTLFTVIWAFLIALYRGSRTSMLFACAAVGAAPYYLSYFLNEWAKDQPLVPNNSFGPGEGAVLLALGAVIMLVEYLVNSGAKVAANSEKDN